MSKKEKEEFKEILLLTERPLFTDQWIEKIAKLIEHKDGVATMLHLVKILHYANNNFKSQPDTIRNIINIIFYMENKQDQRDKLYNEMNSLPDPIFNYIFKEMNQLVEVVQ